MPNEPDDESVETKPVMTVVPSDLIAHNSMLWPPTLSPDTKIVPALTPEKSCAIDGESNSPSNGEIATVSGSVFAHNGRVPMAKQTRLSGQERSIATPKLSVRNLDQSINSSELSLADFTEEMNESKVFSAPLDSEETAQALSNTPTMQIDGHTVQQQYHMFNGADGKKYIQMENGYFAEIISDVEDAQKVLVQAELGKINCRLNSIEEKLTAQNSILEGIARFMKNFNKPSQATKPPRPDSFDREDLKRGRIENFSEFEQMRPIDNSEQFTLLENNLGNAAFAARFFRYFQKVYNLTGKREGSAFFKTLMRKLLNPRILQPYSWKGNRRTMKGGLPVSNGTNISFKSSFPNFVGFVRRIVGAADFQFTDEDNEKSFSDYLRQKNTELKRYFHGQGERRASCTRKRKRYVVPEEATRSYKPKLTVHPANADAESSCEEVTWVDGDARDVTIEFTPKQEISIENCFSLA